MTLLNSSSRGARSGAEYSTVSYEWLRTGEGMFNAVADPVDDKLIEWLRRNPEIARELRIRGGLD